MKEERSSIVNTFYQKCSQLTSDQPSSDEEPNLSFLQKYSSHKNKAYFKVKDKKYSKHKDSCHKNQKFRSDSTKLRDLLKENKIRENTDNNLIYNNSFTSNEIFRVNNINDVFVSSITPEYEVELETTPLEQLSRHDQITITKIDRPVIRAPANSSPWKPDVTVELKTQNEVIDSSSIREIKDQIQYIRSDESSGSLSNDEITIVENVSYQPYTKNYLTQATSVDSSARFTSNVPSNAVSNNSVVAKSKVDSSMQFASKSKLEESKTKNLLAAAYSIVVKADESTTLKGRNSSPMKKKTSK